MKPIHSGKLERWMGDDVHTISSGMADWYGGPIPVSNVPGRVYALPGGDFAGTLNCGDFTSLMEFQYEQTKACLKRIGRASGRVRYGQMNAGFASLSDLISEATTGAKRREFIFNKVGVTGVVNVTNDLWYASGQPFAGAAAGAAPGGTAFDSTSVGAFGFANPTGGDTQHYVNGYVTSSIAANTLLLYDRIFGVTKTMNSTTTEAVTGAPGRYQNTVAGTVDSAENNFLFISTRAALPATAHNWTVCLYTNQAGTTGQTLPTVIGNASAIANRLDQPSGTWFAPLASGDKGIKALTQMQCSAAVASGNIDFCIGHPIAWMPCPLANLMTLQDGLNGAFNLARVFDSACLSFLEVTKNATTATTYSGMFLTVAG